MLLEVPAEREKVKVCLIITLRAAALRKKSVGKEKEEAIFLGKKKMFADRTKTSNSL